MFYTVYKITNKINGKFYIGKHQTKNLDDGYMGSGKRLKYAINKHGLENFSKEILHVFDNEEDMNTKEIELVVLNEESYNLCPGGQGGFGYIHEKGLHKCFVKHSEKTKQQIKETLTGHVISEKTKQNISIAVKEHYKNNKSHWCGRNHSDEARNKISKGNKGKKTATFNTIIINNGIKNKHIPKDQLEFFINLGWSKGRKQSSI